MVNVHVHGKKSPKSHFPLFRDDYESEVGRFWKFHGLLMLFDWLFPDDSARVPLHSVLAAVAPHGVTKTTHVVSSESSRFSIHPSSGNVVTQPNPTHNAICWWQFAGKIWTSWRLELLFMDFMENKSQTQFRLVECDRPRRIHPTDLQ